MSKFSFDETLFVIDLDDTSEAHLTQGEVLSDGIVVGSEKDRGEHFTFYVSEDGRFDILAVEPELAQRWLDDCYLPRRALMPHFNVENQLDCYLIISPSSLVFLRLNDARAYGSSYYAHLVASAIYYTRANEHERNLRDGILCELYGVILPCYGLTPKVADIALLNNVLRGQYDIEDLRGPQDFANGLGGLNRITFKQALSEHHIPVPNVDPCLESGEGIDDMVVLPKTYQDVSVTGALELNEYYQIFSTDTDLVVLALSDAWAEELFDRKLVLKMNFKPMLLGGQRFYLKAFSRRKAVENLNRRHHGLSQNGAFKLALALNRLRKVQPEATLNNALYIQELDLVLPVEFNGGSYANDVQLLREVITQGPFAQGPFLDDVLVGALAVVKL